MVSLPPKATSMGIAKVKVKRVKKKGGKAKGGKVEGKNAGVTEPKDAQDGGVTDLDLNPPSASEDILLAANGEPASEQSFPQSPVEKYILKLEERLEAMEAWKSAAISNQNNVPPTPETPQACSTPIMNGADHTTPTNGSSKKKGRTPASSAKKRSNSTKSPKSQKPTTPKSVSKMQWGILPKGAISIKEILEEMGDQKERWKVGCKEEDPSRRNGAIAMKLYSQLTALYSHYTAIKDIVDSQQPLIDAAQRKAGNADLKRRKMLSKFNNMKAEMALKDERIEALEGLVQRLNEKQMGSMKKLMAAWRNKSMLTCWNAWKGWATEEKAVKMKMKKFLTKMTMAGVARCFTGWAFFISEGKREKRLLERFAKRWKMRGVTMTFMSWKDAWRTAKWERELIKKSGGGGDTETANTDRDFLSGKAFLKATKASKEWDMHPSRVKELKHEIKLLRDENRMLKKSYTKLKATAVARSTSPIRLGGKQRKIRNNLQGIVNTQKNIQKYLYGDEAEGSEGGRWGSPVSIGGGSTAW
mmetsp:Transcript_11400/g.23323  ORF Transcript_11400/g.23323 Transcript_11400/m.23323 type:complete len:529 (-) Transcript_11400:73-1659(-)